MKSLILALLLFVGLGLRAASFTDAISEKSKIEYNCSKQIPCVDFAVVEFNHLETSYFTKVDSLVFKRNEQIACQSGYFDLPDKLLSWRVLQENRQGGNDDITINLEKAETKAPPKR